MIKVINTDKISKCGDFIEIKFDFELDSSSVLPVKTYILGNTTYLIANNSTALNTTTNTNYIYNEGAWTKVLTKSTEPSTKSGNIYTENGDYNVINNELTGINNVKVMVDSPSTVLIDKTITANNTYNATDDNANGYSSVIVDVANSYTDSDEGKVVSSGALVAQTSTNITSNGTVNTTTNNEVIVNVSNTYSAEDEGKVVNSGALVAQTAYPTEITKNRTYDTTNYNSVTVNVPSGSGSSGTDVVFYDYDGTVVASYSAADFANLSAMPANPTHEGLTGQGWNWSLANAKSYVASYGKLNIGQMYTTSDGKTRLYFTVTKNALSADLYLTLSNDTELDIDWGDNSAHTTWTSADGDSSKSHEYASTGRYVIAIEVITGEFYFSQALSSIYKIEIGNSAVSIGADAFNSCYSLSTITIPDGVTSIGAGAFASCYSLSSITIPDSVTSIGDSAFQECYALSSITIPDSVTSIGINVFNSCYALSSITIPSLVTDIGEYAFCNCYALSLITIPNDVTSIEDSTFYNCYSLSTITIPNGVTSIGTTAFQYCNSLSSIIIPSSVEYIVENAFSDCYALTSITFESTTPPELDGTLNLLTTCVIRVPQGTLSTYTSAENYPDPSTYIYEEY